jgi:uncharacterized membrane protein
MIDSVLDALKGIPPELIVFLISMLPIIELRGGLVAAAILGLDWYIAFPICVLGNMLPIPIILLFIKQIFKFLRKLPVFKKVIPYLEEKAGQKGSLINRGRFIGLFSFVAIPLPGTGAWMGALAATLLDIRMKRSFPIIFLGVITAGIIMLLVAYALPDLCAKLFGFSF